MSENKMTGSVDFDTLQTIVCETLANNSPLTLAQISEHCVQKYPPVKNLSAAVHVVLYRLNAKGIAQKMNNNWIYRE